MENNKGSHKEEIWVENLCKKINENENFKSWAKDRYVIKDNVSLAHSISLNNLVEFKESDSKKNKYSVSIIDNLSSKNLKNNTEMWNVDLFIGEKVNKNDAEYIIPRLVIEAKYKNINTHDPITYSHKAYLQKNLFPGLRYGVIIGDYGIDKKEENIYIPTRVVEYGENFDFIFLFNEYANDIEINKFIEIIKKNIEIAEKLDNLNKDKNNRYQCIMKNIEFDPNFSENKD